MAVEIIKAKMYQRRDSSANWERYNPILANGEFGFDYDKKKYKIGDGTHHWKDLEFSYIGQITDENGDILKYKKVATEEYVQEQITPELVFAETALEFPSIGNSDKLYIELNTNKVYTWDSENLKYNIIGSNATLPDEQLIPIVNNAIDLVLVDKLEENVPPIVERCLNDAILVGGNSNE